MFAIKFNGGDYRFATLKGVKDYARSHGMRVVNNDEMRIPRASEGYDPLVDFVYQCNPYRIEGAEFVCTHSLLRIVAVTEEILQDGKFEVLDSPFSLYIDDTGSNHANGK